MTNQKAAEILGQYDVSDLHFYTTDGEEIPFAEWSDAIETAISALRAQDLQPICNELATDTISRQAAIDFVDDVPYIKDHPNIGLLWKAWVEQLPPAEPEIIRCKDCKYWREGTVYSYCDKLYGMGVLNTYDYMTAEDDFCSKAERREE